jgi:hypothetical protein
MLEVRALKSSVEANEIKEGLRHDILIKAIARRDGSEEAKVLPGGGSSSPISTEQPLHGIKDEVDNDTSSPSSPVAMEE